QSHNPESVRVSSSNFELSSLSFIDPVRLRAADARPDERDASRDEDQARSIDVPRVEAAAELQPRAGQRERRSDDDRERAVAGEAEQESAGAARETHFEKRS